ncbi:hypothetical protein CPB85DRAFT_1413169 [Mucidula mucida]|nr:hypothetical protein CPB85DRAFT_1413169 [Mucidula mucida]
MFFNIRSLLAAFTLSAVCFAQSNTNPQIMQIVSSLDQSIHINIPNIVTLQASHKANDQTVGAEIDDLVTVWRTAAEDLSNTPVTSGSTTDSPTNDEIGVFFSECYSLIAAGLSGLTTATVPSFADFVDELDTQTAAAAIAYNATLPGGLSLVHIMMLDAQQFLVAEGFTETLAALGF